MPIQCPTCSKVNPSTAAYCYYDGRALNQVNHQGPLGLGTLPFPTPFCFSDGHSCANFNQLALACDGRWNEAKRLLSNGTWQSFFAAIGRIDLATVASQAAREPDLDVGLTHLVEKWPADADALRPPKLAVLPLAEDLGTLEPGKDHKFDLLITNQGMLVLRGMVMTDGDWLCCATGQNGGAVKLFQTRDTYTLTVRIPGNKVRAGQKPLEGQIVIDTNGGLIRVPVRAKVPIRPFPPGQYANNVLAGARSPRELASKARDHPREAAVLFEQGAVKAWYASNGWTYPVHGTQGKGVGAVQQYFEALGLTRPPRLEINTQRIVCQGQAGQLLTKNVTISTSESRFVNVATFSNQNWIKVGPEKSQGNRVTIPLRIEVPPRPGETLHANVTFQGNGQQQFVVPVTLTVEAGSPGPRARPKRRWIVAGVGVVLVSGLIALGMARRGGDPVVIEPPPPPPPLPPKKIDPWWEGIPGNTLAASVAELKERMPAEQALFDGLSRKSDVDRFTVYEQFATKLPELVRNPQVREPLSRFLIECCVHEPSELNIAQVRRGLARLFPRDGVAFRPEENGGELNCASYALEVMFTAMTHKNIRRERARSLAYELGTVFGFALDTRVPPDELKVQTEKLLAVRCYRNTLPTATKSIEHAITMRASLIEKFSQHLSASFRNQVDMDLIALALSKGNDMWPRVEPLLKKCLESNNLTIDLKVIDLYEKANADLCQKMEPVLAARWKAAGNAKLTHAARVGAIRKSLLGDASEVKRSSAERLAQWQKLTDSTLSAVKPEEKEESAILQDTVRLAHASTMGNILFHKDAVIERFDELIARVPEIEQTRSTKTEKEKPTDGKARQPTAKGVIVVGAQPWVARDQLTRASQPDPRRRGAFHKAYSVSMKAGRLYTIDMVSANLNSYLRLESANGMQLTDDDDSGGFPNARITFAPPTDGVYRVIATTSAVGAVGRYSLQIQQGLGFGGIGFGLPRGGLARGFALGMPFPGPGPEAPQAAKNQTQVNLNDLTDLRNKQGDVRVAAFNNLASTIPNDLAPPYAQQIARYLLLTIEEKDELEEVKGKLESFARCRSLLLALGDLASSEKKVTKQRAEAVIGGVLRQPLRFAQDEDWRLACRKLLLERALDLSAIPANGADKAAALLRDLYKEQGLAFGMEDPAFLAQTRPTGVLEGLIKHIAARAAEKEYSQEIGRHLQAVRFVAENDLEHMVLLQRIWIKVLVDYLQEQVPAQARGMRQIQQDLVEHDRKCRNVLDQLRAGEEKVLRVWSLVHHLK